MNSRPLIVKPEQASYLPTFEYDRLCARAEVDAQRLKRPGDSVSHRETVTYVDNGRSCQGSVVSTCTLTTTDFRLFAPNRKHFAVSVTLFDEHGQEICSTRKTT